ncbi:MAG TPA: hypothetical protein VL096_01875, partial [Pirellulaceae bacterium]|nr:hypothetical protein [Pirellulaceae bacterium]
ELNRTREVFFPNDRPQDARRFATVESNDPEELTAGRGKILALMRRSYEDAEIHVAMETPGLLVLADYFAPGWTAEIEDVATGKRSPATIYRTNRVLRGVMVPAGEQRVLFHYRPRNFYLGAAISAVTWLLLVALALHAGYHRLRSSVTNPKR